MFLYFTVVDALRFFSDSGSELLETSPLAIPRTFELRSFGMGAIQKFSGFLRDFF
ncbi:hypothetical protein CLOSTMETH_00666 [[Clostridium] methylpentosum DSM 5476]|uniref:Uncharacterized protein n=1 Tax=[Clostridium] methylpentosum DSM 5476 TaxID=537013 RepID=C0EA12_9FIRM|nr:hypothetical protein CLOSTMETH_00666 [[Clostridium] methylpentosum DSM 5476]